MSGYDALILSDGPTYFWTFGESSGTTAHDSADSNNGTYTGATLTAAGIGDGETGVTLSGSSSQISTATSLPNPSPSLPLTLEIWFQTTTSSAGTLFSFTGTPPGRGGATVGNFQLWLTSPFVYFGVSHGAGSSSPEAHSSSSGYNDGAWHLAHATMASGGSMNLYLDGSTSPSGSTSQSLPFQFAGNWLIGNGYFTWSGGNFNFAPPNTSFTGTIAKAAVYPYVLSPTQIAAHFAAQTNVGAPTTGGALQRPRRTPGLYPGRFKGKPLGGVPSVGPAPPPPPPLAQVTTLPAKVHSATDVDLFGAVNSNGTDTTAWFAWSQSPNLPPNPNLVVLNPSFEYDTPGLVPANWSTSTVTGVSSGALPVVVSTPTAVGFQALRLSTTASSQGVWQAIPSTMNPGSYVLSAYLQGSVGGEQVKIKFNDGAGNTTASGTLTLTTTMTRYSVAITLGAVTSTAYIAATSTAAAAYTWFADAFMLAAGMALTTYADGDSTTNVTAAQDVGSNPWPVTFTKTLTQGMLAGTTYYGAAVGSSAAGTVYGLALPFVPAFQPVVTTVAQPLPGPPPPIVAQPHFAFPLKVTDAGIVVLEQDTLAEVLACVEAIAVCPVGACPELPSFGIPDVLFAPAPPSPDAILNAVTQLEPRATETALSYNVDDAGRVALQVETQLAG